MSSRRGRIGTGRRDWLWVVTMLVVGVVIAFGIVLALSGGSGSSEPAIEGVKCERGEPEGYHIHSQLEILIAGQPFEVPGDVGREASVCLYWLHTHDGQPGRIHVEAPSDRDFTLGQLFAIWDKPLSSTQLLDRTTDAAHQIRATVDGTPFEGDPATIPLEDGALITLEYGPPFVEE